MREAWLIIICIIFYGSATFFKRLGLLQLHPYQFLLITGICFFLATPVWFFLGKMAPATGSQYTVSGVFCTFIYCFFSLCAGLILAFLLKDTKSPGSLIVMINLSSVITLFLSYYFLNERFNMAKVASVILAILSLILVNC